MQRATWAEMSTDEILHVMRGSVTVCTDSETDQQYVCAGYVSREEPGDGTAACRELARRGVLSGHDMDDDGCHTWEISHAWKRLA